MPPYEVKTLQTREEMDAVIDVIWHAQYNPYMPSATILFPVFGYTPADRLAAITASKTRLWNEYAASDPSVQWMYVRDTATGEIVAGTQWKWNQGVPFKDGVPKVSCPWWPESGARELCEEILAQAYTPRALWMHRPHASLSLMVVHPQHRGRGVGGLMMKWGNEQADERKMEGFIEANELGRTVYEKSGYQVVMKFGFFLPSGKGDEWQKWAHELIMPPCYAMWRPVGGVVKKGERNRPWQLVPPLQPEIQTSQIL